MVGDMALQLSPDVAGSMLNRTVGDINTCVKTSIEGVLVQVCDIQDKLENALGRRGPGSEGNAEGCGVRGRAQPLIVGWPRYTATWASATAPNGA
jgi:hypothetical protein